MRFLMLLLKLSRWKKNKNNKNKADGYLQGLFSIMQNEGNKIRGRKKPQLCSVSFPRHKLDRHDIPLRPCSGFSDQSVLTRLIKNQKEDV